MTPVFVDDDDDEDDDGKDWELKDGSETDIGRVGVGGRFDPLDTDGVVTIAVEGKAFIVTCVELDDAGGFTDDIETDAVDALVVFDSIKAIRSIFREDEVEEFFFDVDAGVIAYFA